MVPSSYFSRLAFFISLAPMFLLTACIPDLNPYDRTWDDPTAHKTLVRHENVHYYAHAPVNDSRSAIHEVEKQISQMNRWQQEQLHQQEMQQ